MSSPARKLAPAAIRTPARVAPERPASTRAPVARARTTVTPRAHRGSTSRFWVLSAVIVTAAVVSVTSMSAMLVRSSFQEGDLRARLTGMAEEQQRLAREVVTLSAPSRVATWARAEGMVIAEDVEVLHVRTGRPGA